MVNEGLKIVCLGGGVGTVQLVRGLRKYSKNITVVCSMADDGGSGGRLRRLYSVPPPGDLINCLAALSDTEPILQKLLTYRFPGDRWGSDHSLGGQKMGNLLLVSLTKILGDFGLALSTLERIFNSHGKILPATRENVSIWAETTDGKIIEGEEKIDLGRYGGTRSLRQVHLKPKNVTAPDEVKVSLKSADLVIVGPGDLYTTLLPVLLVPDIQRGVINSRAFKIYIVNVANKPFETPNYKLSNYLEAIVIHCPKLNFDCLLVNKNQTPKLPPKLKYQYVEVDYRKSYPKFWGRVVIADLIDANYPLYHNPEKLAKTILSVVK